MRALSAPATGHLTLMPETTSIINFTIARATELSSDSLEHLIAESEQEGWRFIRRLAEELASGVNRFERAGEVLLVARAAGDVGVCGLNVDPYLSDIDRPGTSAICHAGLP